MGNPKIAADSYKPIEEADRTPTEHNGILRLVPGNIIGGRPELPAAGPQHKDDPLRRVVVDVPGVGTVRITYRLANYKHRRSTMWWWCPERADLV